MSMQIRKSVFETNSSSMHSIAVMNFEGKYSEEEIKRGVFLNKGQYQIWDEGELDFERYPFQMLFSMWDKARYYLASVISPERHGEGADERADKLYDELVEILKKYCPEFTGFKLPDIGMDSYTAPDGYHCPAYETYYEWDGTEGKHYIMRNGEKVYVEKDMDHIYTVEYLGDIDHQSLGLLKYFLDKNKISLEDFLTDRKYVVIVDGDEYCDFKRYVRAGLIPAENIVKLYPEYTPFD